MKSTHVLLATGVLVVLARLTSLTRHAEWRAAATVWVVALGLLACVAWLAIRAAEDVGAAAPEESRRRIYALTFLLLILVALALGAPAFLAR